MIDQETHPMSDQRFDDDVRASHSVALTRLSARTQSQLRQRLRSTLAHASPARRLPHWQLATSVALSIAVASGLAWRLGALRPADHPPQQIAGSAADNGQPLSVMDETPDLYVWLASDDADRFASE